MTIIDIEITDLTHLDFDVPPKCEHPKTWHEYWSNNDEATMLITAGCSYCPMSMDVYSCTECYDAIMVDRTFVVCLECKAPSPYTKDLIRTVMPL